MSNTDILSGIMGILPEINPNIVVVSRCSGEVVYINPAGEEWLDQNCTMPDEEEIRKLYPPEFMDNTCRGCSKSGTKKEKTQYKGRIYDFKSTPLDGENLCMATITDVTDFHQASMEKELYNRILQNMKQALILTDSEGRILYSNPSFEALYGYSREELSGGETKILNPGKNYYFNLGYPEERYRNLFDSLWQSIRNPETGYWSGEIPNQKKDGSVIWVEMNITSLFDEKGHPTHYVSIAMDITRRKKDELNKQLEIFRTLTEMAELRDNETGNHILRVGQFCRRMAEKMEMPYSFCEDIERFAPMHDIGKVGIPDRILLAERRLNPEEFQEMKTHALKGYELLKGKELMKMAAEIAGCHHEKFDGSGYPRGLKGREIPLSARITAIADIYDALRSKRPYKEAWSHEESINEIQSMSGAHLDPEIVNVFISIHGKIRTISEYLSDD